MTTMSLNSKKICISLFAIVGSTLLFSCNNGSSDKKSNNEVAPNEQTPLNPPTNDSVTGESSSEEAALESTDGISSFAITLNEILSGEEEASSGISSSGISSSEGASGGSGFSYNDLSEFVLKKEDVEEDVTIQPNYFEEDSKIAINKNLEDAQLDSYPDLKLKLTPVCKENKLFNNGKHNIPVRVTLSYNDNDQIVNLSDNVINSIKENIKFSNYIDKKKVPEKIDNVMYNRNEYTKCIGQDNVNLDANDLVFISSDKEMNLIASLDYKKENGGVLTSIPLEKVKKKDLFKIGVLKNPKLDVFNDSSHILRGEKNPNMKAKLVKISEDNSLINHRPFKLKSIAMSLSGLKNKVEIYNTNPLNNLFEKVNSVIYPSLDNHRVISDFSFIKQGESKSKLDELITDLSSNSYQLKDSSRNNLDLDAAKAKVPGFTENEFGFIIKVSDSLKTGLKANLEFKGEDVYGNEFISTISGEKW